MDILESIKLALEGLRVNKMRSFLTMLGIIIGISSVIAIMTIGSAMTNSVSKSFDSFGANTIYLQVVPNEANRESDVYIQDSDLITDEMFDNLLNRFPNDIKAIGLNGETSSGTVKDGKNKANINVNPVNTGIKTIENIKLISGRFIDEDDLNSTRNVAVISDKVVKKIFGGQNELALGNEVNAYFGDRMEVFSVVGIYKYESQGGPFGGGTGNEDDVTTNLYIPLTTGKILESNPSDGYRFASISAANTDNISKLTEDIKKFFNDNYYNNNDIWEVITQSVESVLEQVNTTLGTVKIAIGAIAAISLIVGGIGVMNILLVSVTERTREIGIRKALGATSNDIKAQFIIESIIICIIGGILGVILGTIIGFGGSFLLSEPTLPSITAILIAVGFSMFIGIFFGYYPSNKAAQLDPIDALRYE